MYNHTHELFKINKIKAPYFESCKAFKVGTFFVYFVPKSHFNRRECIHFLTTIRQYYCFEPNHIILELIFSNPFQTCIR